MNSYQYETRSQEQSQTYNYVPPQEHVQLYQYAEPKQASSAATQELDDLMSSLSDFKVNFCLHFSESLYFYIKREAFMVFGHSSFQLTHVRTVGDYELESHNWSYINIFPLQIKKVWFIFGQVSNYNGVLGFKNSLVQTYNRFI